MMRSSIYTVAWLSAPLLLGACSGGGGEKAADDAAPAVATPQTPEAYVEKSTALRRSGKYKEAADTALRAFILARTGPRVAERIAIAKANAVAGVELSKTNAKEGGEKTMGAINEIKSLEKEKSQGTAEVDEVAIAEVYALIGDPNAVFRWLTRAVEKKSPALATVADNPDFESVKSDQRWALFLQSIPR